MEDEPRCSRPNKRRYERERLLHMEDEPRCYRPNKRRYERERLLQKVIRSYTNMEKEMATHSSIFAWEILWTEEPGGLQSTGLKTKQLSN